MGKRKKAVKKRAYVACSGGSRNHICWYGCTGCASCVEACRKNAVFINEHGVAEIREELCVGCRLCEKACPQGIIHMHKLGEAFVVLCSNRDKGAEARKACDVSCIACGLCRKNCPSEAVQIEENCAWIDEEACLSCGNCVVKCPRNVICDIRGIIKK